MGEMKSRAFQLIDEASKSHGVTVAAMIGRERGEKVELARRMVWTSLRSSGMNYSEIGELFGRHHTTIIAGIKATQPADPEEKTIYIPEVYSESVKKWLTLKAKSSLAKARAELRIHKGSETRIKKITQEIIR